MKRTGKSYQIRLAAVNAIYDRYARTGLSNREIWRRYIYPRYGISERTLYDMLKQHTLRHHPTRRQLQQEGFLFPEEGPFTHPPTPPTTR